MSSANLSHIVSQIDHSIKPTQGNGERTISVTYFSRPISRFVQMICRVQREVCLQVLTNSLPKIGIRSSSRRICAATYLKQLKPLICLRWTVTPKPIELSTDIIWADSIS